jgi:hypothetical protein
MPKSKKKDSLSAKKRDALPDSKFAFSKIRKEPLVDAKHVRNALARFDQVENVSDKDRDRAWERIVKAAKKYDVDVAESDWRDFVKAPTKAKKVKHADEAEKPTKKAPKRKKSKSVDSKKDDANPTKVKKAKKSSKPKKAKKIEPDVGH